MLKKYTHFCFLKKKQEWQQVQLSLEAKNASIEAIIDEKVLQIQKLEQETEISKQKLQELESNSLMNQQESMKFKEASEKYLAEITTLRSGLVKEIQNLTESHSRDLLKLAEDHKKALQDHKKELENTTTQYEVLKSKHAELEAEYQNEIQKSKEIQKKLDSFLQVVSLIIYLRILFKELFPTKYRTLRSFNLKRKIEFSSLKMNKFLPHTKILLQIKTQVLLHLLPKTKLKKRLC